MSTADRLTTEKNESKILPPKQNLRLYKHVQSKLAMQNRTRESTFTRNTSDHRTSLNQPNKELSQLLLLLWRQEWHCMAARSCSARARVKMIYMRMPDSRTKASTCLAAAVQRRISGVEKFIPRFSTACFRRSLASENLGQTSITCSTVSGI